MRVFYNTDVGIVRKTNQDAVISGSFDGGVWAVVCDGMGGANGGDFASARASEIVGEHISSNISGDLSGAAVRAILEKAIEAANLDIFHRSLENKELFGMGTTIVAAVMMNGTIYLAHVGDSRAYKISGGSLTQLTRDHSMVQEMLDLGKITEEEARNHPRKNVITRALGVHSSVEIDHTESTVSKGDMILLCTDGLTNFIDDAELLTIARQEPAEAIVDKYISVACKHGGGDNITALVI